MIGQLKRVLEVRAWLGRLEPSVTRLGQPLDPLLVLLVRLERLLYRAFGYSCDRNTASQAKHRLTLHAEGRRRQTVLVVVVVVVGAGGGQWGDSMGTESGAAERLEGK